MQFFLPGHQVTFRDFHFLLHRITAQINDLETIAKGGLDILEIIGRGNKEYLTQVILHLQVIIIKRIVLFGIEHFQ